MYKTFLAFIILLLPGVLVAEVWVYSYPDNSIESSPFYKVNVVQDNQLYHSFTCFSKATSGDIERSSSWTTFSFNQEINIEVEVLSESVTDFIIRPISKNISAELHGNKLQIKLTKPQKLCVEINGNRTKPLFIFADKPEENIPDKNEKGLWFFETGIHKLGAVDLPDTVKHIYISGGAYVEAAFINRNRASNLKITGRGILSSPILDNEQAKFPIINFSGEGINSYVEGITILNGQASGIEMQQSYSTLRNCKFFEWNPSNGGVFCGPHALIENCFFRSSSDVIKMYRNYLVVQQCIFWQNNNGATFQMGYNLKEDFHSFRITDCDVICCEHKKDANNAAVFSAVFGGVGNLSDYLFENIRIEGDVFRLFKLTLRTNPFDTDLEYGSISNVLFKNISLDGKCNQANEIWGYNQEHRISKVTFENLQIAGQKITNVNDGQFKINLNTTSEIIFN